MPRDGTLLGALFESLVTLDVRTGAQAAEASVSHLRTRGGEHEVDLIVVRDDKRVVAIEVKLTRTVDDELSKLKSTISQNVDRINQMAKEKGVEVITFQKKATDM